MVESDQMSSLISDNNNTRSKQLSLRDWSWPSYNRVNYYYNILRKQTRTCIYWVINCHWFIIWKYKTIPTIVKVLRLNNNNNNNRSAFNKVTLPPPKPLKRHYTKWKPLPLKLDNHYFLVIIHRNIFVSLSCTEPASMDIYGCIRVIGLIGNFRPE